MITFQAMDASHAKSIAEIHTSSWRSAYAGILPDEYLKREIEQERLRFWTTRLNENIATDRGLIAYLGNTPVGFIYMLGEASDKWGVRVDNLHVLEGYRGRGVAVSLLQQGCVWACGQFPTKGVFLWCYDNNRPAFDMYLHLGGRIVERENRATPGGGIAPESRFVWDSARQLASYLSKHHA